MNEEPLQRIVIERGLRVPMRDGLQLVADVYRPESGRYPVLVQRTPYGRGLEQSTFVSLSPRQLAEAGFAVVVQDTRGRGDSDGEFDPFHEADDGFDTVQWAATQAWSNGRVGGFGSSYMAATQLQAATLAPPALETICPAQASSDYFEGRTYWGGACEYGALVTTSLTAMLPQSLARAGVDGPTSRTLRTAAQRLLDSLAEQPVRFPLRDRLGDATGPLRRLTPWLFDWIAHDQRDHYWQRLSVREKYPAVQTSALHITSWYDQFHTGTLANYRALREHADRSVADGQYLIVGPWLHYAMPGYSLGAVRVGDHYFGAGAALNLNAIQLAWFKSQLTDHGPFRQRSRVRYFLMGADEWREADDWPPPGVTVRSMFLGGAGDRAGAGHLLDEPAAGPGLDSYDYDPTHPVPTSGGAHLVLAPLVPSGPLYQDDVAARSDVLTYTSAPLENDVVVAGAVTAVLHVRTDGSTTDFTGRLADVDPDGRMLGICDGIVRMVATGESAAEEVVSIELGATAYQFAAGHRIALLVSSSNFPRFDPNPNTGESAFNCSQARIAHQTVLHGGAFPSRLDLPVVAS
jgi:putative CocE/NonD family hydrolase